jgi:autotransporter-associated beta strand protein
LVLGVFPILFAATFCFAPLSARAVVDVLEADLLCAYAPSYASSAGGEANAQVNLANAIAGANVVNENSGTGARMRITGFYRSENDPLNWTTTGGMVGWLNNNDSRVADVVSQGIALGADLVTYVCQNSDSASIAAVAQQPGIYSAHNPGAVWYIVMSHEIGGHNYGCAHADGMGFTGNNSVNYRTVMVHNYCGGSTIPYLTNPNLVYQGVRLQGTAAANCNTGGLISGGNNTGRVSGSALGVAERRQRVVTNPNLANVIYHWAFTNAPGAAPAGTTIPDAVSGAPAVVRGINATFTGSGLRLPGGTTGNSAANSIAAYIDLPNHIISAQSNLTMEIWATPLSSQNWQRICSFGRTVQAGDGLGEAGEYTGTAGTPAPGATTAFDELALSFNRGGNISQQRFITTQNAAAQNVNPDLPTLAGAQQHYAITYEQGVGSFGASGGRFTLYRNGDPVTQMDVNYHLNALQDVNNWLGRSLWSGDSQANAEYAEVRLSSIALSRPQVQAHFRLGPNYSSALINLVNHDALNTSSFNTGLNWSNSTPPNASSGYDTLFYNLRTPAAAGSFSFAGDQLKVSAGGQFLFKGTTSATITVNDLQLDSGSVVHAGAGIFTLAGNVNLAPNGGTFYGANGAINLTANLIGASAVTYLGSGTTLAAANTGFAGRHFIGRGTAGRVVIDSESRLGPNPPTFTAGQLTFNNGTLQTTASLAISDPNRGLTADVNGAIFSPNTGTTLTLARPLTGGGGLTKAGGGTLLLAANNTFTGILNVDTSSTSGSDGVLRITNGGAVSSAALIQIRNNNSGSSTLQLDGSGGGIVITKVFNVSCRNNAVATIQNVAGTNTLTGRINLGTGGNMFNIQSDAGQLTFSGINQYNGDLTGGRTYAFSGAGHHLVSGAILNSTNGAPISLSKTGPGTLTMTAANTYGGSTTVSGGTLLLNGSLATSSVTVGNTATLAGNGTIGGAVTVQFGGTMSPGTSVGRLTVNNTVTLQAGSTTFMELDQAANTNDVLRTTGTLTYGGNLVVTNLAGTLAAGDSFRLFDAPNYSGAFANLNLPPLDGNLIWQFTPTNGTLAVVSTVATTPTNIVAVVIGNTLELSWPDEHTGWILQAQTNAAGAGLGANWFNVADSAPTNRVFLTIDPAHGSVFYRLELP